MNERLMMGLIVAIADFMGVIIFDMPFILVSAESFLTVEGANVSIDDDEEELTAELIVEGLLIPTNGTEGAFGYGITTDDGDDTMLVAHTHPGVLDSEEQTFIEDPIWHNHFVRLGEVDECGEDEGVVDITWQSPGEVEINDYIASISDVPTTDELEGWHSITGEELSMTLGEDVSEVISFKIDLVFGEEEGGLEALCVTDMRASEEEVNLD